LARFLLFPQLKNSLWETGMQRQDAQFPSYYDNLRHFIHDLAQPLSTVTGLIDLMLLELDERDKMFQEVQLISQQLEKVMQIVEEIRHMAREAADHERNGLGSPQAPLS
jgi:signal transduction histidine kinase